MVEVGDIQIDKEGEWVVVAKHGRLGPSRVRRYSLAHRVHAQTSEVIAQSLHKEMHGGIETTPEGRPDAA